ncbi:MAG: class I SAM-dependent methyltransferase [Actinomycetota bacterium]
MRETLKDRLIDRIDREGPMSFAQFMEAALYHEEDGFYSRTSGREPVGEAGHFVTSPHVSPAFGDLLARQVAEAWELLGKPKPYSVIELGAGSGMLATQILAAVRAVPELAGCLRYVAVERTPSAIERLRTAGLEVAPAAPGVGRITGCVIANELLDNLPFHRLRERAGRAHEVMVGAEDGRLIEVEAEASGEVLEALGEPLRPGEERQVSIAALETTRSIAETLDRGYAFLFDYGFVGREGPGPVHAYRNHQVLADVLEEPGSRDVTAAVDFSAIVAEAEEAGLQTWGPVSQRDALLGLGFRMWIQGVRNRQRKAEARGDWREANRLFAARSRASILVDEGKLGSLRLLVLGTKGLPAPAAVLGDRDAGC